jgi:hypothetical protein
MLRKVKLYIENTAFDDSRILRKRGKSGILLHESDIIFKQLKVAEDAPTLENASVVEVDAAEAQKIADAQNKMFNILDSQNSTKKAPKAKKTCVVDINGELSDPLIEGVVQSYTFSTEKSGEKKKDETKQAKNVKKLMLKLEPSSINDLCLLKYYPKSEEK